MGCNGSRVSSFKKPNIYEPELPPVSIEEQGDSHYLTRSKSTSELASIRKTEGTSLQRAQSLGYYEKNGWPGRSEDNSVADQKKIKRLLQRQKSEKQALEAFKADAALNETITLPELREITQVNDKLTRPGTNALMIDPYTGQSQGHILQPFSQPMREKVGAGSPYLIDQGGYDQYGYIPPMHLNKNIYEPYGVINNRYETGYIVSNSYEPWNNMQPLGTYSQAYNPRNTPMINSSLSYIPLASPSKVVMGQRPGYEGPVTQAIFSGYKDDPFGTSENSREKKANPSPIQISGRQMSNTVSAGSPARSYHMSNQGLGLDEMANKSKESKSSKYGEASIEFDSNNSPLANFEDLDPNMDTLELGPRMSEMLEGLLTVDSSSSTTQEMTESGVKTKGGEEENWEELVKGINAGVSTSSSSSEVDENVNTTKMGRINETNWQANEQPAGF